MVAPWRSTSSVWAFSPLPRTQRIVAAEAELAWVTRKTESTKE